MASYTLIALTNSKPEFDAEYNQWFDAVHIPEVLKVKGIVAATRFRLASAQRTAGNLPYKYAALYRIETGDLPATLSALGDAVQKGTKTAAGDPERRALWVFEQMGEEHLGQ